MVEISVFMAKSFERKMMPNRYSVTVMMVIHSSLPMGSTALNRIARPDMPPTTRSYGRINTLVENESSSVPNTVRAMFLISCFGDLKRSIIADISSVKSNLILQNLF